MLGLLCVDIALASLLNAAVMSAARLLNASFHTRAKLSFICCPFLVTFRLI